MRFTKDHEWVELSGDIATVGITAYAANALGDVVFVETPDVGKTVKAGDGFAVVESVKAASDVYAPVSGEVVETNEVIPVGISPPQAADLLLQGVEEVQKHPEVEIPAFRWFLEQNWAIFADVVFPDSMGKGIQAFKEVFIAALVQFIEKKKTAEQPDPQLRV